MKTEPTVIDIDTDAHDGYVAEVINEDDEPDYGSTDTAQDVINEDADEIAALPKGAKELADGSVEITLNREVTLTLKSASRGTRTEVTDKLRFHRLTGKDLTEITNAAETVRERVAFAVAARMNKARMNALFDRMDAADISRCGQVLEYFLGSGRKTGRS